MGKIFVESRLPLSAYTAEAASLAVVAEPQGDSILLDAKDKTVESLTQAFADKHLTEFGKKIRNAFAGEFVIDLGCGILAKSQVIPTMAAVFRAEGYVGVDFWQVSQIGGVFSEEEELKEVVPGKSVSADYYAQDILEFVKTGMDAYDGGLVIAMVGLETNVHQIEESLISIVRPVGSKLKEETEQYIAELMGHIRQRIGPTGRVLKGTGTFIPFEKHGFTPESQGKKANVLYKLK